jgi:hypothetical protein
LCAAAQDLQQGELFLQEVKLTIVNTKKFNRVNCLKVDNRLCQCATILG